MAGITGPSWDFLHYHDTGIFSKEADKKGEVRKIMKFTFFFLVVSLFMVLGCVSPAALPVTPIGKGTLNPCISDPTLADYWQNTDDVLWSVPGNAGGKERTIVSRVPACDNSPVIVWDSQSTDGGNWDSITILTKDGLVYAGWLPASHLSGATNETGTEWSKNYYSIVGPWDQSRRGNGPRIWFEFTPDGAYTYNYDMMGNRENVQDRGSWTYRGNGTYDLISNTYPDHRHISIVIDQVAGSFDYGVEYSSGSGTGTAKVFARE
jgi:hypothetical protein